METIVDQEEKIEHFLEETDRMDRSAVDAEGRIQHLKQQAERAEEQA